MANKSPSAVMRKIAADAVEKVFDYLPPEEEDELVTSVVRQWITYDGHAVLLKEGEGCYLVFRRQDQGYGLGIDRVAGPPLDAFLRDWQIDLDQTGEILHGLNVRQSAEVTSLKGLPLRFSVDPKRRTIQLDDLSSPPKRERHGPPPLFCPQCSAVLNPWRAGQAEQRCPHCGRVVRS